jgi:hypothetical protein
MRTILLHIHLTIHLSLMRTILLHIHLTIHLSLMRTIHSADYSLFFHAHQPAPQDAKKAAEEAARLKVRAVMEETELMINSMVIDDDVRNPIAHVNILKVCNITFAVGTHAPYSHMCNITFVTHVPYSSHV